MKEDRLKEIDRQIAECKAEIAKIDKWLQVNRFVVIDWQLVDLMPGRTRSELSELYSEFAR